jgi:hypothetical protein
MKQQSFPEDRHDLAWRSLSLPWEEAPGTNHSDALLDLRLAPEHALPMDYERLERTIEAWQNVGAFGAFGGGSIHSAHVVVRDGINGRLLAYYDAGSAGRPAVDALITILEGVLHSGVPILSVALRPNSDAELFPHETYETPGASADEQ